MGGRFVGRWWWGGGGGGWKARAGWHSRIITCAARPCVVVARGRALSDGSMRTLPSHHGPNVWSMTDAHKLQLYAHPAGASPAPPRNGHWHRGPPRPPSTPACCVGVRGRPVLSRGVGPPLVKRDHLLGLLGTARGGWIPSHEGVSGISEWWSLSSLPVSAAASAAASAAEERQVGGAERQVAARRRSARAAGRKGRGLRGQRRVRAAPR